MKAVTDIPLTIDLNLEDDESVLRAASALGTTPEAVRTTVGFAQIIVEKADDNDMSRGQLITALMRVLTLMVRECGTPLEQGQMCFRLMDGLWASCDLPEDRSFMQQSQAPSFPLLPVSDESVH